MQESIRVNLPDGRVVHFPAEMAPQEIEQALSTIDQPPDQHSVSGFAGNVLESGGRFIGDTVKGALSIPGMLIKATTGDPVKSGQAVIDAIKGAPSAIGKYVSDRYGSLGQAGETLYHDPIGVAGDVSTVAGGGALAAAKAPRIAGTLGKIERMANPMTAIGAPIAAAGSKMRGGAVSANERMLKANKSTLAGMPQFGRTLEERSRAVAQALLDDPHGQISKSGARRFSDRTDAIKRQVDALVDANPEARGSTAAIPEELARGRETFRDQWAPSGDTSAYDAIASDVVNNPRINKSQRQRVTRTETSPIVDERGQPITTSTTSAEVTGRTMVPKIRASTARELTQGTYRNLGDKAYGELKGAQTQAHKAAGRAGRRILNEAIPEVEPLNRDISRRLDLGQVQDEAVFRSGKHDPISLGQQVMVAHGNPSWLAMSLINRPGVGSPLARGGYKAGKALEQAIDPEILRAALIARLLGSEQ